MELFVYLEEPGIAAASASGDPHHLAARNTGKDLVLTENWPGEKQLVIFEWGVSSYFGWGVYGLNLMLQWALRPDFEALSALPIRMEDLLLNPLEMKTVEQALLASAAVSERRRACAPGTRMRLRTLVLHGLGNQLTVFSVDAIVGQPTIGVVFSEFTVFDDAARERAKDYALIVAGSTWNRDALVANGIDNVAMVMQGVDPTYFHPATRLGLFRDRFVVFSGGKLEHRKGQDLAVQAFRIFAERHADALLVTAWASPWPELAASLASNPALAPFRVQNGQLLDSAAWTQENGIRPEQTLHLGPVPRTHLPRVLREADVALFPNRAEGGTNLVAMECMACGVPIIVSANTGHLDLIQDGNCYVLERQSPLSDAGCDGWGESDVEEILAKLEAAYADRVQAAAVGLRGSEFMSRYTWAAQLGKLAELLHPYRQN